MSVKSVYGILFFILTSLCVKAQVTTSANPPSIKWQQIENDNSTVIFPKGLESQAYRFATIIDLIDKNKRRSIGPKASKIPIVMHGLSMEPNGFVASVPFRSEIYTTPFSDWNVLGQVDWLDVLAIHEYRHVLQNDNATVGFSKLARIITGRSGWSAILGLTDPAWFAEGDAVVSESLLTNAGRGRLPSFTEEVRANMYAGKSFSYNKSRNGSFKTLMPSHYPFGYLLNLKARKDFGNDVWASVIHDANYFKSLIYPFSGAIKRNTGLKAKKLYTAAYSDFEAQNKSILESSDLMPFENVNEPHKKEVENYTYSHVLGNGDLVVRKSTFKETPHLFRMKDGKRLVDIGHSNNNYISYSKKSAIWLENQTAPRWDNVDLARIVHFDFSSGEKTILQEKDRIYYAAISPDDKRFISVKVDLNLDFGLGEYDKESGSLIMNLSNEEDWEIGYPMYDLTQPILYYIVKKNSLLAIVKHHLVTGEKTLLTNWENNVMVEPAQTDDYILFRGTFSGIDNVYAVSKSGDKQIRKLSSVPVSAGYPAYNQESKELLFSNSTNTGYYVAKSKLDIASSKVIKPTSTKESIVYKDLNALPENDNILDKLPDNSYESKPYKGFFRGWKFHSWGLIPAFGSSTENSNIPSLSSSQVYVNMDDILGANSLNLGYTRYLSEDENAYSVDYGMGKYFVKFNVGYEYRGRKVEAMRGNRILEFDEQEATVGLSVPLEMIAGNYTWRTNAAANWKGIQQFRASEFFGFDNSKFGLYEVSGNVSAIRRRAYQNLQPKFGFTLGANFARSFKVDIAERLVLSNTIFLPGIGRNHGLELQQAYYSEPLPETIPDNVYRFPFQFSVGRGRESIPFFQQAYRTSVNYRLPLLYPDFGLNGITYFKRLRMNLFFDYAHIKDREGQTNLKSIGGELRLDQTFLNFADIPVGIRVGYRFKNEFLPDLSPVFVNFIFGE